MRLQLAALVSFFGRQHRCITTTFALATGHERDSAAGVPLVPANVLRQLGQNDRLVITGNKPPAHAKALDDIPRRWRHHTRPIDS